MDFTTTYSGTLLLNKITTGAGSAVRGPRGEKQYQASGTTSAGSGSATIVIQGSNDGTNWDPLGTITLTLGTSTTSDDFLSNDRCTYVRANVTAISGTDASVTVTMSY